MIANVDALLAQATAWMEDDPDPITQKELSTLISARAVDELQERFGARLEFGTAGLRGVLGAGPNRMNRALIRRVTAGLAAYLLRTLPGVADRGVVVGRDARRLSRELAEDTAAVLAGAGIRVHYLDDVAPTPVAAFAVSALSAGAGIVVTASHNPPEYNGYKVYWENAAQIIPPHDLGISEAIDAIPSARSVPWMELPDARTQGRVVSVSQAVLDQYVAGVLALRRHPEVAGDLKVVYTPMHGVGGVWVNRVMREAGYNALSTVPEQEQPDGEFPTVAFPNPEEPGAMDLSLALAEAKQADLVLANDPDADRLAAIARDRDGKLRMLSGNQIGIALGHYLLTENPIPGPQAVMTTIVSTSLLGRMAQELGVRYEETLTGFKWIANRGLELEPEGIAFTFGFEEALGYTVGNLVRDKDGVGAALLFSELAAWCRTQGNTVWDYLEAIYRRFGLAVGDQTSITLPGSEGSAQIAAIMERFRAAPLAELAGVKVVERQDLRDGTRVDMLTGKQSKLVLPSSNVLVFIFSDGSRILLRPSGTEPKIKYYFEVLETVPADLPFAEAESGARKRLAALQSAFVALAAG